MKYNYRNRVSWKLETSDMEIVSSKSKTVPDQAYTVREILTRFSNGVDLGLAKSAVFAERDADYDDEDLESLKRGDLVDRVEAMERLDARKASARAKLQSSDRAKAKAAADDEARKNDDAKKKSDEAAPVPGSK